MLFFSDQDVTPYFEQLQDLSLECFDCDEVSPADFRFIEVDSNNRVIAHSAIVKQKFKEIDQRFETYLLGYVSVRRELRGIGLGRKAVEEILKVFTVMNNWAVLLNCSYKNQPFYEKLEFKKISEKAIYTRNGAIVIENDPVLAMYKSNSVEFIDPVESIFFGEEF